MGKYSIYKGQFTCKTCGEIVETMRFYPSTNDVSWMCKQKHLNEANLYKKKTKEDYEREKRE